MALLTMRMCCFVVSAVRKPSIVRRGRYSDCWLFWMHFFSFFVPQGKRLETLWAAGRPFELHISINVPVPEVSFFFFVDVPSRTSTSVNRVVFFGHFRIGSHVTSTLLLSVGHSRWGLEAKLFVNWILRVFCLLHTLNTAVNQNLPQVFLWPTS